MKLRLLIALNVIALIGLSQSADLTQVISNPVPLKGDQFGFSQDRFENTLAVGSPFKDCTLNDSLYQDIGAVYIYNKINGSWELIQTIFPPDMVRSNSFGYKVLLHHEFLIVKCWINQSKNRRYSKLDTKGVVYIFKRDENNLFQILQEIKNPRTNLEINFATSITFWNEILVISSIQIASKEPESSINSNGYYDIYIKSNETWRVEQTISTIKENINGIAGNAVVNDSILAFEIKEGTKNPFAQIITYSGAVYLYKLEKNGDFKFIQRIIPSDPSSDRNFGSAMIVSKDLLAISLDTETSSSIKTAYKRKGAIEIFHWDIDENSFKHTQRVNPLDSSIYQWFGNCISYCSGKLAVGSMGQLDVQDGLIDFAGAVYLYEKGDKTRFDLVEKLVSPKPKEWSKYGFSISLQKNELIVGSRQEDIEETITDFGIDVGRVFVYTLP